MTVQERMRRLNQQFRVVGNTPILSSRTPRAQMLRLHLTCSQQFVSLVGTPAVVLPRKTHAFGRS